MNKITVAATIEYLSEVTDFINNILANNKCSKKTKSQIDIAIDEAFSNIVYYSGSRIVTICCFVINEVAQIIFIDNGLAYDPLAKEDPKIFLSAEQRQLGGLGIYMVKKSMDFVGYLRYNDCNILTIKKMLEN